MCWEVSTAHVRILALAVLLCAVLVLPAHAPAAGGSDCLASITTTRTGDGDLTFWGKFSMYKGESAPRGTVVPPDQDVLPVGGIFTVPAGMTIEYKAHGLQHTFTGPGRWGTYCQLIHREGTSRVAYLATQFWKGKLEDEGPKSTFRDAYTVTPEGRVSMSSEAHVHYEVERKNRRTIASVFKDGGKVFVSASDNLSKKTPCQSGDDVVIEHDGRIH